MFSLHENVVYPGYGVARINRIVEKNVGNAVIAFYELAFFNKDATVLVPMDNAHIVGLRSLSTQNSIHEILSTLSKPIPRATCQEFAASSWNKRNKNYQLKLRAGSLRELVEIYSDLRSIGNKKKLSFGEKNLLAHIETLLVEEISIACKLEQGETIEKLRETCT